MTVLLAILISGVLLDANDQPMPIYHLTFISADGKLIEATTTDKDGKFQVELAPGTYRLQIGFDGTVEPITVDKSTKLTLKLPAPPPQPQHTIEIIQGTQRIILSLPLGPAAPPPQPPRNGPSPVIEAPRPPERYWHFDIPLQPNPNPKA